MQGEARLHFHMHMGTSPCPYCEPMVLKEHTGEQSWRPPCASEGQIQAHRQHNGGSRFRV